jgi:predicted SAM-dependent methyltransferase
MNKLLSFLASRMFSSGERLAWQKFLTEVQISRYHRNGLREVGRRAWSRPTKLNLGCGPYRKEGFLNVDLFPGGELTLDLRRPLPFESNCCDLIFSEHFIEHLDYPDTVSDLFRECFRILAPNGLLRFSVPDTGWPLTDYAKGPDADYFRACDEHRWHPQNCTTRLEHINYHFRQGDEHRFAYDEETATKLLRSLGFSDVWRVPVDPIIDSQHRQVGSLIMSGRKPVEWDGRKD